MRSVHWTNSSSFPRRRCVVFDPDAAPGHLLHGQAALKEDFLFVGFYRNRLRRREGPDERIVLLLRQRDVEVIFLPTLPVPAAEEHAEPLIHHQQELSVFSQQHPSHAL
jgi:hypothetical protein